MHVCDLSAKLTTSDLRDLVLEHGKFVVTNNAPLFATVSGYDKDSRELWEIPEVARLCQRVIESGVVSLLAPNMGDDRMPGLLGAWDVWAIATGKFVDGISELTPAVVSEFVAMLSEANKSADVLIAQDPSGHEKAWYLRDGPAGTAHYAFSKPRK